MINFTNKHNLPLAIAVWLANDNYDYSNQEKCISVTTLLNTAKSVILSGRCTGDTLIDVYDNVSSAFGTAIHESIDAVWTDDIKRSKALKALGYPNKIIDRIKINPENIDEDTIPIFTEKRSTKELNGWTISGKFDFVGEDTLFDFKTAITWCYTSPIMHKKYLEQLSIYKWLNKNIIKDDNGNIIFIFTDWSALTASFGKNYPPLKIKEKSFNLMNNKEVEEFISNKLDLIDTQINLDQSEMIPCSEEELSITTKYKYYKNPNSLTRATKVSENYWELENRKIKDGNVGIIKTFKGKAYGCRFCNAKEICDQAKEYKKAGMLDF